MSPAAWRVWSEIRIVSTAAADSSRLAVLTVSPITVKSRSPRSPTSPAITSPVLIPIRQPSSIPRPARIVLTCFILPSIPRAARTARSGSSSLACLAPNRAMMQSPMYLSTIPP